MSILFDDASSEALSAVLPAAHGLPLSMAAWGFLDDSAIRHDIISLVGSGGSQYCELRVRGDQAGDYLQARIQGTGSFNSTSAASVTFNAWQHFAGKFTTGCTAFLNGVKANDSSSTSINAMDGCGIGSRYGSADNYVSGRLFLPCIWAAELSDEEFLALANGWHPFLIRPESIITGPELWSNYYFDPFSGLTYNVNGSPSVAENPGGLILPDEPMIYPPQLVAQKALVYRNRIYQQIIGR